MNLRFKPSKRVKLVKKVRKVAPYLGSAVDGFEAALDLDPTMQTLSPTTSQTPQCVVCKGSKLLCGKTSCPLLTRLYSFLKVRPLFDRLDLEGSSPPGVFVGRYGYPKVYAGPLIPPVIGDTAIFDAPEEWIHRTLEEILNFRFSLVRGKKLVKVTEPESGGRIIEDTRDMTLASGPVETEVGFKKKPNRLVRLDPDVQPMGPAALLEKFSLGTMHGHNRLERAYGDRDLKAAPAVIDLYENEVSLTKITRAFSMGCFGIGENRRMVPTRWSITAVDSTVGRHYRKQVKQFPFINEFRVFEATFMGDHFKILMSPFEWSYELVEAWFPGSAWNPSGRHIGICSDWESHSGRSGYASIGGCYYAARAMVTEYLADERRQASVVILRESRPSSPFPLGVWKVRECVREALRQPYLRFDTGGEALDYMMAGFKINLQNWIEGGSLLARQLYQRRLTDYA
ncbi:MAG: hypothetical protein ACFFDP_02130 [Promethearchaeota archaeon]